MPPSNASSPWSDTIKFVLSDMFKLSFAGVELKIKHWEVNIAGENVVFTATPTQSKAKDAAGQGGFSFSVDLGKPRKTTFRTFESMAASARDKLVEDKVIETRDALKLSLADVCFVGEYEKKGELCEYRRSLHQMLKNIRAGKDKPGREALNTVYLEFVKIATVIAEADPIPAVKKRAAPKPAAGAEPAADAEPAAEAAAPPKRARTKKPAASAPAEHDDEPAAEPPARQKKKAPAAAPVENGNVPDAPPAAAKRKKNPASAAAVEEGAAPAPKRRKTAAEPADVEANIVLEKLDMVLNACLALGERLTALESKVESMDDSYVPDPADDHEDDGVQADEAMTDASDGDDDYQDADGVTDEIMRDQDQTYDAYRDVKFDTDKCADLMSDVEASDDEESIDLLTGAKVTNDDEETLYEAPAKAPAKASAKTAAAETRKTAYDALLGDDKEPAVPPPKKPAPPAAKKPTAAPAPKKPAAAPVSAPPIAAQKMPIVAPKPAAKPAPKPAVVGTGARTASTSVLPLPSSISQSDLNDLSDILDGVKDKNVVVGATTLDI